MKIPFKPKRVISLNYSMVVCLPAVWCNQWHINKGDLLDVKIDEEGTLLVRPIKHETEGTVK